MKLFSKFKKHKDFNLRPGDFKTETDESKVISAWISPELLEKLPNPPSSKQKDDAIETKTSKAKITLLGQTVELTFDPNNRQYEIEKYIRRINEQLNWTVRNKKQVHKVIIRDLLGLKNSTWLDENETQITEKNFLKKVKLTSVNFFDDTSFELYYDDGNIFGGHSIVVSITANKELKDATIEG